MKPEEWGWHVVVGKYLPMLMDKSPALPELWCGCKNHCDTNKFTCRRHGIFCSDVCLECKGISCINPKLPDHTDLLKYGFNYKRTYKLVIKHEAQNTSVGNGFEIY